MATADQAWFVDRLRALLPRGWFGESTATPFLTGILNGIASFHASAAQWLAYAKLQIRIATATGEFLDIICSDFLGTRVARRAGEADSAFRARILREILRPRTTRASLIQAVQEMVGTPPVIIEPANAADTAALDYAPSGYNGSGQVYGSGLVPFQVFVVVNRPPPGSPYYGISDADIYAGIVAILPVATTAWVRLVNPYFVLDVSTLDSGALLG